MLSCAPEQVLLDKLVRPKRRVTSYLTSLTGLQAKDFEGVSFSFEDAQVRLFR